MYYSRLLIFCFICSFFQVQAADTTAVKKKPPYRNTLLLNMSYGRQAPLKDMALRFGGSNTVGAGLVYKFGNNWQVQAQLETLFSGKVKEDGVFDSMIGQGSNLVDNTGTFAEVRMYERGYLWHIDFGKIIHLDQIDMNSGLLFSLGAGFIEHRIKFTFQRTVLPQVEGDYYKGY